jgi:uncharacterized membrane protein
MDWAIASGTLASLSSVFGKLSTATFSEELLNTLSFIILNIFGLFICNSLMWNCFTKALNGCKSTIQASVINTTSNFGFTVVFGLIFFNETLTIKKFLGIFLMLLGSYFVNLGSKTTKKKVK